MINFRMIRHLWLFLAVAEEKHFGRAAKRLGMSQPPLTEQIQALEQALRVKLLERGPRGTRLTAVGAAILPAVRSLADHMERIELLVREAVLGQSGTLTIGAISSALVEDLPPLLQRLRQEYPKLTISMKEIDSVEAIPALEAGEIDLAFARLEGELGPGMRSLPVRQDWLSVALPQDHELATMLEIAVDALADEQFVMFSRRVSPIYFDNIIAACRAHGLSPRILHEVRSVATQIAFVSCGQGVALVPSSFAKLATDRVVVRPLRERIGIVTGALVWSDRRPNPLVDAVVQFAKDAAGR